MLSDAALPNCWLTRRRQIHAFTFHFLTNCLQYSNQKTQTSCLICWRSFLAIAIGWETVVTFIIVVSGVTTFRRLKNFNIKVIFLINYITCIWQNLFWMFRIRFDECIEADLSDFCVMLNTLSKCSTNYLSFFL